MMIIFHFTITGARTIHQNVHWNFLKSSQHWRKRPYFCSGDKLFKVKLFFLQRTLTLHYRAVLQLTEMRMENCHLRNLQLVSLFDSLQTRRSIRILDLSLNNMAGVDEEKLAVIINDIVEVIQHSLIIIEMFLLLR